MKNTKALLISFGFALFAFMLVFSYVAKQEKILLQGSTMVKVVVAAQDIGAGTRLDESNLTIIEVPKKYAQPGTVDDDTPLFDRIVYVPVLEGVQIIESMLASPEKAGLAQKIPKDKRGFTVAVNNITGVAGLLQPGDFVDILLTVEVGQVDPNTGVRDQEIYSKVVLENILILAVNQRSQRISIGNQIDGIQNSGSGNIFNPQQATSGKAFKLSSVTLAVSQEECLRVSMAQEIGSITLALRSSWNRGDTWKETSLESLKFLGVEKPVVRRALPAWVEIRGAEQESRY